MENRILWQPDPARAAASGMGRLLEAVGRRAPGRGIGSYDELYRWSVDSPDDFWRLWLDASGIAFEGDVEPVRSGPGMFGVRHFERVRLSFADNLLRHDGDGTALVAVSESRPTARTTFAELRRRVASVAAWLASFGLRPGDRVAAMLPNGEEAVVAMLATAALGGVWSSCSPDFGARGVIDRFGQIAPRLLLVPNAYRYGGKLFDCRAKAVEVLAQVPSIERVVVVPHVEDHPVELSGCMAPCAAWSELEAQSSSSAAPPPLERRPFNHPLYILYSSGTTGVPKCIVHGAGGTLLQHAKELSLHCDLRPGDNICYFTTCGWMMWNWLVSSLFTGATVTLFDGSPTRPNLLRLWSLIEAERITHFGTSPKFLGACRGRIEPRRAHDLSSLRVLLSTGAPLLPEDFDWVYDAVASDLQLSSISGGTDIISCFMLGNPLLPVYRGEIQCLGLGMDVVAMGPSGPLPPGQRGELVCRRPFPSMPVGFFGDAGGERYRAAYFDRGDDCWYHGDFIALTGSQGSCGGVVVYGRSDATLNPGGVRIGTAEIYRLVESHPLVEDSIAVGQPFGGDVRVVLFVQLVAGAVLSPELEAELRRMLREGASPRHVPAVILQVRGIPYTFSGKKVELAVLDVVCGREPANVAAIADPGLLVDFRGRPELAADQ